MKDDHEKTAETIWPDPPKDAREAKARRAAAQTINFAKLYGGEKSLTLDELRRRIQQNQG